MATEIEPLPSPPMLPEGMNTCQVGYEVGLEESGGVSQMGMGDMSQQTVVGAAEVSIKMLMSSKVSGCDG